jgi:hypothetical protein
MQAHVLAPSERQEVQYRWKLIFMRQLDSIEQDLNFATEVERGDIVWLLERCAVLADRMLSFDEDDEYAALELMMMINQEDGPLWQRFLVNKDIASIQMYLESVAQSLSCYVNELCAVRFPPQLYEFDEQMAAAGLDELAFIKRARQAFLAFTFIVSKMNMLVRENAEVY